MSQTSRQGDEGLLAVKQLDQALRQFKFAFISSLMVSMLVVIALWPVVEQGKLLVWLASMYLIMRVRLVYVQRYFKIERMAGVEVGKWKPGYVLGSAASGICWGATVLYFPVSPFDPASVLLIFILAGVSAFASVSMATVPPAAIAFLLSALFPSALWLFSFGDRISIFMGLIVLAYVWFMVLLVRQMHNINRVSISTAEQNVELSMAVQAGYERMTRFFESVPGFFFTATLHANGSTSMPFASKGIEDILGLERDDVARSIAPLISIANTPDMLHFLEARSASLQAMSPLDVELRINHAIKGERWIELRSLPQREADGSTSCYGMMHDITQRKFTEQLLQLKEFALDQAREAIYLIDVNMGFIYVNEEACRALGYSRDELLNLAPADIDLDCSVYVEAAVKDRTDAEGSFVFETRHRRRDGSVFPVEIQTSTFEYQGRALGLALARDISDRKRMEEALAAREQESRTLIDNSPDNISRYNRDCMRIFANTTYGAMVEGGVSALLGKKPSEYPGGKNSALYEMKIAKVFSTGEDTDFELTWPSKDGREICSHVRLAAERDASGSVVTVLAVGRDITDLNSDRQKIHQMAFYDTLTSLPNRALFNDRLRQMLTNASWHGQQAGVMLLDLDRFKAVNDTLGHPAGDDLLREASARLANCVRAYDTVARLGGDEFAILLPEIRSSDDLGKIANKILEIFNEPFMLEGKEVFTSTSVGIAVYPDDSSDADDLIKQADSAMYFAKRSGRNNFRFYSKDLTVSASEKLTLESELRRALERNELELYYQPKVWLADSGMIGSEALLRWNNPLRGMVPPDQFIGIAEDSGLIVEIGEWVLREACRTACHWNGDDKPLHKVAINLSARQFQSGDLVRTICGVLDETGCQPEWIELEITESLLLDEHGDALQILEAFQALGISIAIDDFGTGYSALSYLARYPINTLKIDRSFIHSITTDNFRAELVKAIISIAHCLGQHVVAEGVETPEQAAFLQVYGCQAAQGYLYSKPVSKSEFELLPQSFVQV